MAWTDPNTLSAAFDTDDVPTGANFDSLFNDLLSLAHTYGARETAEKGVQNSTTETSLYTTPPTLTGGDVGTIGTFGAILSGRFRQGTTAALVWTWRVKLGGTTLATFSVGGGGSTEGEANWWVEVFIEAQASQSSQRLWCRGSHNAVFARSLTILTATSAIDLSVDQTFDFTVQMGTAGANDYAFKQFSKQYLGKN